MNEHHHETLRVLDPQRQNVWGLAAAINFTVASGGAAFYIFWTILKQTFPSAVPDAALIGLLSPAMVLAGFGVLAVEAGRPFRVRYLLARLGRSWMSREVLAGMLFLGAALSDVFLDSGLLRFVAVVAALSLMLSQAMMLYRCSAVPLWRDPVLPVAFISSGWVFGYGMMLLFRAKWANSVLNPAAQLDGIGLACLIVNAGALALFLVRPRHDAQGKMLKRLRHPVKILVMVGIGQIFPVLSLTILGISSAFSADGSWRVILFFAVGVCVLIGSLFQKLWMIRDTQFICEMETGAGDAASAL